MSVDGRYAAVVHFFKDLQGVGYIPRYRQVPGLGCGTVERKCPTSGMFCIGSLRVSHFLHDTVVSSSTPADNC